jgi:predicted permease
MTFWSNLTFAARQLRKSPAFTITVLATLALCIGVNAAIYSIVDALFLRPLPYPQPERLVMLGTSQHKGVLSHFDTGQDGSNWEMVRDHASLLESAVYGGTDGVNLYAGGHVEYVQEQRVSANFFGVLGVPPLIGREFTRQEDVPGGPKLTVLSHALWQRLFHGDSSIVGRTVDLLGAPHTVVGVMPAGFRSDTPVDLWTPLQPSTRGEGGGDNYSVIARLKPGVTLAEANGQLAAIMRPIFKDLKLPPGVTLDEAALPLQAARTADIRSKVKLMWGAVILVLIIGCVNIAGILLARSGARSREIATRLAIGARRQSIIWQLLTESLLLSIGGGLLGLLIAQLAVYFLTHVSSIRYGFQVSASEFEIFGPVQLDARVMIVTLAIALSTSMLFGLFPAVEATSLDLRSSLVEGGRGATAGRKWTRRALVFAEVALGVVLVVGAGLMIRTVRSLMNLGPGFNPQNVMTASMSLHDARYVTTAAGVRLFRETLAQMRQIPSVESAAVALTLPYQRALNLDLDQVAGKQPAGTAGITDFTYVTPEFFETLQISLLRGRPLVEADGPNAAKVVVANEAFIRYYLPHDPEPLGVHVKIGNIDFQIVGVVGNVQQINGWGASYGPLAALPQVYAPVAQIPDKLFSLMHIWFSPSFLVKTRGNIAGLPEAMRRALRTADPRLPFSSFHSMAEVRGASVVNERYQARLFSALAGLALLLSALGVYGLIAQSVAERTREMGIRLALGATAKGVVRAAAMPGIKLSLAGVAGGLLLALYATRVMKSLIWGITTTDPWTFATVAALLVVVAAVSSIIPALRLTRLDPVQTLRQE